MTDEVQLKGVILNSKTALLDIYNRALRVEDCIFSEDGDSKLILQELDYVLQSVHALAEFLGKIAEEISNEDRVFLEKALKEIPLSSLSDLFSGTNQGNLNGDAQGLRKSEGAVDLF